MNITTNQHLVNESHIPFVPAYIVWFGGGPLADILTILIILPLSLVRCGRLACVKRNVPRPFTLTSRSQSANVCSSNGLLIAKPAQFTTISILPHCDTAASTNLFGAEVVDISASTNIAGEGRDSIKLCASASKWGKGKLMTVNAPRALSSRTMPAPIPELEPLTIATFPASVCSGMIMMMMMVEIGRAHV